MLLYHNIRFAVRYLRKYKTQNIISIVGLAVGFVCFAFSALWIRYEKSYDNFHKKADRIYRVNTALYKWNATESNRSNIIQSGTPYTAADWLKSNYPEIEEACAIQITRIEPYVFCILTTIFVKYLICLYRKTFF